ncbi:DUF2157 domain-containing protein [Paenibacillus thalictri]|uniref:DUF2157 domain-containing protein n=1 Tax=Paenibacillus thalictri TaxID=2527873 RepID=A0A4Q9DYT1_9BACL|nr:DUF2157 domain-containing protein [Paenibacillus thalictri]TBL81566.1 DUF2157 domain-containing protein [Paenibacillus thalictri]
MSRKWLEREGLRWVEEQIVSREQYDQILGLYDEKKNAIGLLPVLGSILTGLGIISFIAANWQDIPQWLRLLAIIIAMSGFYISGDTLLRRGHEKLGIGLVGIGLITFGAGIALVGQMFHLVAYDTASFIVWGSAGALLAYLYRSRYLYLISIVVFDVAQIYAVDSFRHFSYAGFALMAVLLGGYVWKRQRSNLLAWMFNLSLFLQVLMLFSLMDWKLSWIIPAALLMYAAGDWLRDRSELGAVQAVPLLIVFAIGVGVVLFGDNRIAETEQFFVGAAYYLPALLVPLALSAWGKLRNKREVSSGDWLMFLPVMYVPSGIDLLYLVMLFLFSLFVLWRGYSEEWRMKINLGTVLFIFVTMVAYGKLTWDFMDKSLFFVLGGGILLVLSWFLNRRKNNFLGRGKVDE